MLDRYQKRYGDRGLKTERSYIDGVKQKYGTKGSVRLDVYDAKRKIVYDYKFTKNPGRGLSKRQINKIREQGPKGIRQIREVNP